MAWLRKAVLAVGMLLLCGGVCAQAQATNHTEQSAPGKDVAPPADTYSVRILNSSQSELVLGFWYSLVKPDEGMVAAGLRLGETLRATRGGTSFDRDSIVMRRVDPDETIEVLLPQGKRAVFAASTFLATQPAGPYGPAPIGDSLVAGMLTAPVKWVFWRDTGSWNARAYNQEEEEAYNATKKSAPQAAQKEKDDAAARLLRHQQESAERGEPYGQFRMGQRHLTGDGVEKDPAKARVLFQKAADQGHREAADALAKLNREQPLRPQSP